VEHLPQASLWQREVWRECKYKGVAKLCCASPFVRTKQKKDEQLSLFVLKTLCYIVPDYLTFIDDYLKILDFIKWLKVAYPEKAMFLTEET
jgi:hypothetical protein